MKKLKIPARAVTKLGIAKDKLRVLSHDKLEQVGGGDGDNAPGNAHQADRNAFQY
jgi:hypothetical protein